MIYYLDTEFLEGSQNKTFLGVKYGETNLTIDLISIGIVSEENREYYAISKDFNLKEAWNRYDLKINKHYPMGPEYLKEYWIRKNVLIPIFFELANREFHNTHFKDTWRYKGKEVDLEVFKLNFKWTKNYKWFKKLINKYGKTNKEIAEDIKYITDISNRSVKLEKTPIEFYAYYGDYDWVIFCWLFGKMIDLPKSFPMYCKDLKQFLDDKCKDLKETSDTIKELNGYPKQDSAHNALDDARWNKKLHEFLKSYK